VKLENRKQKVSTLPRFFKRLGRYSAFAFALVSFSVLLGTVGYRYLADISWVDSFYMACMILTGMGPVVEMTDTTAKLFSAFYALYSGVAFLSITAVFFAPIIHRVLHILHVEDNVEHD
jgi:ADP-glucose pyrophosphorylase